MGKRLDKVLDVLSSEKRRLREEALRAYRSSDHWKKQINNLSGGYYRGNRKGRMLGEWSTTGADANEMLAHSISDLRNDSHDLFVNNPIATGIVNTYVTNVVGAGLSLCPAVDHEFLGMTEDEADALHKQINREWKLFTKNCDITRQSSWPEQQQVVLRTTILSGDIFANLPLIERKHTPYETAVNLIEGHRVCNQNNTPDTDSLIMGIQIDSNGTPVKYHYYKGTRLKKTWHELKAFDSNGDRLVLHIFRKWRTNQMRGAPLLAPIIEVVKKLDTYSQAEVDAAVINAFFTVFIKKKSSGENPLDVVTNMGDETGATGSDKDLKLGSGLIVELFDDEEGIDVADPNRPNQNFEAFFRAIVSEIAVGVNLPYEIVMKQFQSSYSASRGAIIEAIKVFNEWENFLVTEFCQPVYEAFFQEAVIKGRIDAPKFFDDPLAKMAYCNAEWIGQEQAELDPMKAANAAEKRINIGISNEIIETQARGRDYANVVSGQKRAKRLRREDAGSVTTD